MDTNLIPVKRRQFIAAAGLTTVGVKLSFSPLVHGASFYYPEEQAMSLEDFVGEFEGTGNWYDSEGNTMSYKIQQTHQLTDEGIDLIVKHAHNDGDYSEGKYNLKKVAPYIYKLFLNDKELGYGTLLDNCLRFHFDSTAFVSVDSSLTEISYQMINADNLVAYGSTTQNSAGNYITWHEQIKRTA